MIAQEPKPEEYTLTITDEQIRTLDGLLDADRCISLEDILGFDPRSRPVPESEPKDYDMNCNTSIHRDIADRAASKARGGVLEDLWKFCLINGAEEHGDIVGLPKDPFFPLKLIKKIAEMRYESLRQHKEIE